MPFDTLNVKFDGRYAKDHLLDIKTMSTSLVGANALINKSLYFLDTFNVPNNYQKYPIRIMMRPPQKGTFNYDLIPIVLDGTLPLFADAIARNGQELIWRMVSTILFRNSNKENEKMEPHFEALLQLTNDLRNDRNISDEKFVNLIEKLALSAQSHSSNFVTSVGNDTNKLILPYKSDATEIDIASAEIIRSKGLETSGDLTDYKCQVVAVNKQTRTVALKLEQSIEKKTTAKVADPVFDEMHNIYIRALDEGHMIGIKAKPLFKDNQISKLIIMDASEIED